MRKYYRNSWGDVVKYLGGDIYKGLTGYDAHLRKEQDGSNKITLKTKESLLRKLIEEKVLLYMAFINIIFYCYQKIDIAIVTTIILGIVLILSLVEKRRVLKRESNIENINYTQTTVLRSGKEIVISAEELVKGDIVVVRKGSLIAADVRLFKSKGLKVNDSSITGDTLIKEKFETKLDSDVDTLGEVSNMLFRGSYVVDGEGAGIVVEIGDNTQLGKIISDIRRNAKDRFSISNNIQEDFIRLHICLLLFGFFVQLIIPGAFIDKINLMIYWTFGSIVVLLPMIAKIQKKYIKDLFKEENIELSNISSIKSAAQINVMFLNQVGTLTKEELQVKKVYINQEFIHSTELKVQNYAHNRLLEAGVLANDAKGSMDKLTGNMYEKAYIKLADIYGVMKQNIERTSKRLFVLYMDSEKRIISSVNKVKKGYRSSSRGNVEDLLKSCTYVLVNGVERPLDKGEKEKIKMADLAFSKEGFITEAFAYRNFNYKPTESENIESNLVFLALVAMENPLIDKIEEDIKLIVEDEIRPIIFTDNNKIAGEKLARQLGVIKESYEVISGVELEHLTLEEFYKVISKGKVFCKVTPKIKAKMLDAFNNDGYKVLVEGDNLQDIANIKGAFLSIAKGQASKLINRASDVYARISPVKAFKKLKDYNVSLERQLKKFSQIYILLMISELVALSFHYMISEKILFNIETIIGINTILFIPIVMLRITSEDEEDNNNWYLIRLVSFIIQGICSIFLFKNNYIITYFVTIGMNLIIHSIINYKNYNKKYMKPIVLGGTAIIIFAIEFIFITYNSQISFDYDIIGKLVTLQFVFVFMELFIKKWR